MARALHNQRPKISETDLAVGHLVHFLHRAEQKENALQSQRSKKGNAAWKGPLRQETGYFRNFQKIQVVRWGSPGHPWIPSSREWGLSSWSEHSGLRTLQTQSGMVCAYYALWELFCPHWIPLCCLLSTWAAATAASADSVCSLVLVLSR